MEILAFRMKLFPGYVAEYKKRHDQIWPELKLLLKEHGISEYRIFLDEETHYLFSVMTVDQISLLDQLPDNPIMKKWWYFMKDIMETNEDNSPVSVPLKDVFFME
ncbi:MAG: L-rhamnose mutarotase [Bacteroidota bacterium]|jgi:L-rhamnose mutarotase